MKYQVSVETLSPLHIGSGTDLIKDFDYITREDETLVLNQEAIYALELGQMGGEARFQVPAGRLVTPERLKHDASLVRYTLAGAAQTERVGEQIKDVHGRCYLPGSSLKGALRTALLAYALHSGSLQENLQTLDESPRWAASAWERQVFGKSPNDDILRLLQVRDSAPLALIASPLILVTARVFSRDEPASPVEVEAVRKNIVFHTELVIDELTSAYAEQLKWQDKQHWLAGLVEILQLTSAKRIADELHFARENQLAGAIRFYEQLSKLAQDIKGTQSAVIQLGWGSGWSGITIGTWLNVETRQFIRKQYQLGKPSTAPRNWQPNLAQPFPRSRRLRAQNLNVPGQPLGWVVLSFEPGVTPSAKWQQLEKEAHQKIQAMPEPPRVVERKPELPAQKPGRVPKPVRPSTPTAPRAEPAKSPLRTNFERVPNRGDRFYGEIFEVQATRILLSIPGLDADTQAYAEIEFGERKARYRDGETVLCEVIGFAQDFNVTKVICREG